MTISINNAYETISFQTWFVIYKLCFTNGLASKFFYTFDNSAKFRNICEINSPFAMLRSL